MLMPEGIKPRWSKLQANKETKLPTDIKTIIMRSFEGLCNLFHTHIKDFDILWPP
jgi:hypothetical protein